MSDEKKLEKTQKAVDAMFDLDQEPSTPDGANPLTVRFSRKAISDPANFQRDESPDNSIEGNVFSRDVEREFDVPDAETIRAAARQVHTQEAQGAEAEQYGAAIANEFLRQNPDYFPCPENSAAIQKFVLENYDANEPLSLEDMQDTYDHLLASGQIVTRPSPRATGTGLSERQQARLPDSGLRRAVESDYAKAIENAPDAAEAVRLANEGLKRLREMPAGDEGDW